MRKQLEARLTQLKTEFQSGQRTLAELEAKAASIRETMLRISGAIQVLEEELAKHETAVNEPEAIDACEATGPKSRNPAVGI